MTDLKGRIGRKAGEKLFPNKSWVRPGFEASPKRAPRVWNTANRTIEDGSDTGSHDDEAYSPPHPPVSPSNVGSPSKRSLLDRMNTPIIPEGLHNFPETVESLRVQKPLIERVDFGRKDDGTFESESESHNIEDGMDIDLDNDIVISSESKDQTQKANKVAREPFESRMDSLPDSNQRANSTVSTVTNAQNQSLPLRNNDPIVNHQEGNLDSHRKTDLPEPVQNVIEPSHSNPSNLSSTHPPPPKPFTLDPTNNVQIKNAQINKVMVHDKSRHSDSTEEGELRGPLSPDQVRVVLLPLMLRNAESRIKHAELKATSSQHAAVNPKVLTDQVCATFSEIGQNIRKEMKSRDLPRRSPPRVDPSNGFSDANAPIASASTANRVQSSRRSQERDHVQNSSAYNQRVDTVSNGPGMIANTAGLPARPQDALGQWQSNMTHTNRGPSQRRTPDPQEPRVQRCERRRASEPRNDERRPRSPSRGPPYPRGAPDRRSTYGHERRSSDREYDYSRPRRPPTPPPRTSYIPDRRYNRSTERRSRSRSRDNAHRLPYPSRGRGDYSHKRGYSRDDDHRTRQKQSPYRAYNTNRSRSRSPLRRGPRTPPPRDSNTYKSQSRSPLRRGPRTSSPRGSNTYKPRTRSPLSRGPRTPPPRENSSRMSTRSPLFDRRPRSNERSDTRDRSTGLSMSSKSSTSKESTSRPKNMRSIEPDKEPHRAPSHTPENTETRGNAEPPLETILPCHNVPGLWFVKVPLENLGTLNCEFKIDHETAVKWNIARTNNEKVTTTDNNSVQISRRKLSLEVCSFSKQLVQDMIQRLGAEQTPTDIANAMLALEQSWPHQGQLIITVNPDIGEKKTWLPHKLGGNNTPVHIENYVHEGDNIVQFVQLSGMSDNLFALCASERADDPVPILPPRTPLEGPNAIDSVEVVIIP